MKVPVSATRFRHRTTFRQLPRGRVTRIGSSTRDGGTALVEFVVLAVVVMVPLAYAVAVVVKVHSATYATITAAREASRAYVSANSTSAAASRARAAATLALRDQGLGSPHVVIQCLDGACLAPGSTVHVEVSTEVAIPLLPNGDGRSVIPVSASHEAIVDTYRRG